MSSDATTDDSENSDVQVEELHQTTSRACSSEKHPQRTGDFIPKTASKQDIRKLVQARSSRISLVSNSSKSDVWSAFKIVALDGKNTNFVKCETCSEVYSWISGAGTNALRRHRRTHEPGQPTSTSSQPLSMLLPKVVPENSRRALNRAVVLGLAKDLRPIGAVNGTGFGNMAQALVNFGARHGQVNVKKALYDRTTLKRSVLPEVVMEVKEKVVQNMRFAAVPKKMSFTMDLWTDKYRSRHFLSLTTHYIDKEFNLHRNILGVEEFPYEHKGTLNVRSECSRILRGYFAEGEVSALLENAISVTDSGSNVTKVFKTRKPCQCHKEHNFLDGLFSPFNMANKFQEIHATMSGIKDLVRYVKKAGINKDLPVSLKQSVTTRWCSELTMVSAYLKVNVLYGMK